MLYTIAFITNQQLRDIKLEGLLNPDFVMEKYVHEGTFDFSVKVNQRGYFDVWGYKSYNEKCILRCTKWKTIRGAEAALKSVQESLKAGDKRKFSVKDRGDAWRTNEYIPVICDITDEWNTKIQAQINQELKEHQNRMTILNKKIVVKK